MKRLIHVFIVSLLAGGLLNTAYAQSRDKYYWQNRFRFQFMSVDTRTHNTRPSSLVVQDDQIYMALERVKGASGTPKSPILLGVKLNPKLSDFYSAPVTSISKTYTSYVIADSSDAVLVAMGINKHNYKDYQYRVIENDSAEIVPWSDIPKLEQKYGAKEPYGFIGKFNAPGKQLLAEVQQKGNYNVRDGIVFDWRVNYKPVVTEILVHLAYNGTNRLNYFNLNYTEINKGYATKFDKATRMPLDFKFPVDSVDNLRLSFKSHLTIPYSVYITKNIDGKIETETVNIYLLNNYLGNFIDIDRRYFNKPGKYEITIHRNAELGYWKGDQALHIPFVVLPPPNVEKQASLKEALPYIAAALAIIAVLFWLYRRQANIRLAKSVQARQNTNFKLRSIRAQLNPHFMFNALTSIQNLVNKKDLEGANDYLSRFAGLTRKVLNTSERDLISLEDEVKILDDYLQMEQLRFGFRYNLNVAGEIALANIEVPAMLLQPFVENAVKHGIANMREKGEIKVNVSAKNTNLVFAVTDNGLGFKYDKANRSSTSFGLKMSEERIALLNEVYKDQPAKLHIQSDNNGTTVTITLTNWIS